MGLVLAFQSAPRPQSRTPQVRRDKPTSADILFFTGVRYQRQGSAPIEPSAVLPRADKSPPFS